MGHTYAYVISSKEGKVNYISEQVCVEAGEVLSGTLCVGMKKILRSQ